VVDGSWRTCELGGEEEMANGEREEEVWDGRCIYDGCIYVEETRQVTLELGKAGEVDRKSNRPFKLTLASGIFPGGRRRVGPIVVVDERVGLDIPHRTNALDLFSSKDVEGQALDFADVGLREGRRRVERRVSKRALRKKERRTRS